jgi:peptidoglycan/LPS O-acetylase OafA/YrhL
MANLHNEQSHLKYRPDIDGLRAVAVLCVVIFHVFPSWLTGGFVGVDVFFVISGFLITGILLDQLLQNNFSFGDFYAARIRRIFPALIFVLAASLIAGWFFLSADAYRQLGKHVAGGAGFAANFILWNEAGYFDTSSSLKPLLHLWSMGIEEQFYVLWPFILWCAHKKHWPAPGLLMLFAAASFAADLASANGLADFYDPATRFWELMLGALLARLKPTAPAAGRSRAARHLFSIAGILLILGSAFCFDRSMSFPSWRALLPCLGTVLLIGSGARSFVNRTILAQRPMVRLGLISYPFYLWHWPFLTYVRIVTGQMPSYPRRIAIIAASLLLAWLTYMLIEKPIRFGRHARPAVFALCILMALTGGFGFAVFAGDGFGAHKAAAGRQPSQIAPINNNYTLAACAFDDSIVPATINKYCSQYGDSDAKETIILWGDSHSGEWLQAWGWSAAFYEIARLHGHTRVIRFSTPGCPPLLDIRSTNAPGASSEYCQDPAQGGVILEAIRKLHPDKIVMIARWSLYTKGQRYANGGLQPDLRPITTSPDGAPMPAERDAMEEKLLPTVEAANRIAPVLILKNFPVLLSHAGGAVAQNEESLQRIEPTLAQHIALSQFSDHLIDAAARLPNVKIFDPAPFLCSERCAAIKDNVIMYRDDSHPSPEGALLFVPSLKPLME